MWLIDQNAFVSTDGKFTPIDNASLEKARIDCRPEELTLVIGNGLSRTAVYEHEASQPAAAARGVIDWWEAVETAYKEVHPGGGNAPQGVNALVLAETVVRLRAATMKESAAKLWLLGRIAAAVKDIPPSRLHCAIAKLGCRNLVTTNYDQLIERGFAKSGMQAPLSFSGRTWAGASAGAGTTLYKMHGSFDADGNACNDIVIAESDYDRCSRELVESSAGQFWDALNQPLLVLGKGIAWEDLSFMYALRRRHDHCQGRVPAYWIAPSLSAGQKLTLENMGIQPLLLNMPSQPATGHHYFATAKALAVLFSSHAAINELAFDQNADDQLAEERKKLIRAPTILAIGLSAQNTAGRVVQRDKKQLPVQGRHNHEFKDVEDYPGGSALTAIAVSAALMHSKLMHSKGTTVTPPRPASGCALLSTLGSDPFGATIRKFCHDWGLDDDGFTETKTGRTWRSTVIVHTVTWKNEIGAPPSTGDTEFGGQRVFLDQPLQDKYLTADLRQFDHMMQSDALSVVYLDKWLATGSEEKERRNDRASEGFLGCEKHHETLRNAVKGRSDDRDVIFETGGGGSFEALVEKRLSDCVNVLTAGFSFFSKRIACLKYANDPDLSVEFQSEYGRISKVLELCPGADQQWVAAPEEWVKRANTYLRRNHRRKWLVTTLHDRGALVLDLSEPVAAVRHFKQSVIPRQAEVENTAGAGDALRGALCFALSELRSVRAASEQERRAQLERCVRFAVRCASERCTTFLIGDALDKFAREGFSWWQQGETGS